MEPLTFAVHKDAPCEDSLPLQPFPQNAISEAMWEELAAQMAGERTLIPYPAATLARRHDRGYAAVAICDEQIIGYTSLSPIALCSPGDYTWKTITVAVDSDPASIPSIDVFEFTGSWTDPRWRGKRINLALRLPLARRFLNHHALGIGGMVGLTSSVLAHLGWQVLAWNSVPFVSSLSAVPYCDFADQAGMGWRPPEGVIPYQGPNIPYNHPTHRWEKFCHFWVSEPSVAAQLNLELAALARGDLNCWQAAVVAAFARSGTSHRLAFLG